MRKIIVLLLLVGSVTGISCNRTAPSGAKKKLTIGVIPKGTTHEFWKSIHAGANKAAAELTAQGTQVDLIWKGPLREDDREQQIQVVENFVSQSLDGIVLAPLDNHALVRPVEEAKRAGVPAVIIDSSLESEQITSFVATDNRKGGALAADRMNELLGGKGKVVLLRYAEGSASTLDREAGFIERLKEKYPGLELISSDRYAGATRDTAKRASENLLTSLGEQIQGIFTSNESATAGMLSALQDFGKAGKISFVGFDASDDFITAMKAKQLHGIVVQNPFNMGYLGVRTMVESLQGKSISKRVDTGVTMVTLDNLTTPDVQTLLHPPLDQYLK